MSQCKLNEKLKLRASGEISSKTRRCVLRSCIAYNNGHMKAAMFLRACLLLQKYFRWILKTVLDHAKLSSCNKLQIALVNVLQTSHLCSFIKPVKLPITCLVGFNVPVTKLFRTFTNQFLTRIFFLITTTTCFILWNQNNFATYERGLSSKVFLFNKSSSQTDKNGAKAVLTILHYCSFRHIQRSM